MLEVGSDAASNIRLISARSVMRDMKTSLQFTNSLLAMSAGKSHGHGERCSGDGSNSSEESDDFGEVHFCWLTKR